MNLISIPNKQGRIITCFKETKDVFCMSTKLDLSNSTIAFKINLYKAKKTRRYHYIIFEIILSQYKQFGRQAIDLAGELQTMSAE